MGNGEPREGVQWKRARSVERATFSEFRRRGTTLPFIVNETRLLTRREGGIFLNLSLVFIFRRIFRLSFDVFTDFSSEKFRVDVEREDEEEFNDGEGGLY